VFENGRFASETSDLLLEATMQSRHREKWREHAFHIKRKYRRQNHRWSGVVRRNRHDFNYRLRWALKCMTRCACSAAWRQRGPLAAVTSP